MVQNVRRVAVAFLPFFLKKSRKIRMQNSLFHQLKYELYIKYKTKKADNFGILNKKFEYELELIRSLKDL